MKNKILCVHQGYELYGSDRVFIQSIVAIRQEWPKSYITIHLPQLGLLSKELEPMADRMIIGKLSVLRKNSLSLKSLFDFIKNIAFAYKQVKSHDLIYINTGVILSYNILSLFITKKFILHVHEIVTGPAKLYLYLLAHFTKARILVNSKATAKSISSNSKADVVYNGVSDIKSNKASSGHGLNLLLIGRINSWKGHGLVLEALRFLKDKGINNIFLRFVGNYFNQNEHYLQDLCDQVEQLDLTDQIVFYDFCPDPSSHYEWADIVLVPSTKPEPFGLVAIEAMRAGLPVIAANHGGLPEIIIDRETGILFEPNNVQALVHSIEQYINNPSLISKHGEAGRIRFLEYFQEKHYMANFISVIKDHVQ